MIHSYLYKFALHQRCNGQIDMHQKQISIKKKHINRYMIADSLPLWWKNECSMTRLIKRYMWCQEPLWAVVGQTQHALWLEMVFLRLILHKCLLLFCFSSSFCKERKSTVQIVAKHIQHNKAYCSRDFDTFEFCFVLMIANNTGYRLNVWLWIRLTHSLSCSA